MQNIKRYKQNQVIASPL